MNTTSRPEGHYLTQDEDRSDSTAWSEIGFSEFPIVAASLKRPSEDTLEYLECVGHDAEGEPIHRGWQIVGSHEYGRPRLPDLDVFVALLKLLEKHNYEKKLVVCGAKQICDIVGIPRGGETYKRLRAAFLRFQTTSYVAKNIFTDPRTGDRILSEGFSIIADHRLLPDHKKGNVTDGLPPSYFAVSAAFLNRLRQGTRRPIDLTLWRELPLGLEKPLYHVLDNRLWGKNEDFAIGLCKLARKVGITGKYYPSDLKRLFGKALTSLVDLNFLDHFTFEKTRSKDDPVKVIVFPGSRARTGARTARVASTPTEAPKTPSEGRTASQKGQSGGSAHEERVLSYFSLSQFGVPKKRSSAGERRAAREILQFASDDPKVAEAIIDFALEDAERTGFDMRNISGVLLNTYPERALKRIEARREEARKAEERERLAEEVQEAKTARAEEGRRRFEALPEPARAELVAEHYRKLEAFARQRSGSAFTPENLQKWARGSALKEFIDQELPEVQWMRSWREKRQDAAS